MKTLMLPLITLIMFSSSITALADDSSSPRNEQSQSSFYGSSYQKCEGELKSLGTLNKIAYKNDKAHLDANVDRATRYLILRPTLSPDIQNVMDSIHQANIAKTCQRIHQDLYAALLKEAEATMTAAN